MICTERTFLLQVDPSYLSVTAHYVAYFCGAHSGGYSRYVYNACAILFCLEGGESLFRQRLDDLGGTGESASVHSIGEVIIMVDLAIVFAVAVEFLSIS